MVENKCSRRQRVETEGMLNSDLIRLVLISRWNNLNLSLILYDLVGWTSLTTLREQYSYIFIYKKILSKPLADLSKLLCGCFLTFPRVLTDLGKTAFSQQCTLGMEQCSQWSKIRTFYISCIVKKLVIEACAFFSWEAVGVFCVIVNVVCHVVWYCACILRCCDFIRLLSWMNYIS